MKRITLFTFAFVSGFALFYNTQAQNKTDVSLFMRSDSIQKSEISAESGDLYNEVVKTRLLKRKNDTM